ncbi:MAG: LamG-like jellyroll fold domain-containing protein, partial [Verrucomicrobiota bacterium]
MPDGQNTAWINVTGTISQTLSQKFEAGRQYRLSVDVGAPAGLGFPGYVVGLYANGQAVAVDENTNTVGAGGFATVTVAVTLPEGSPAVGALIEIRLGIPGSKSEQTDFDNVRLTAEAPVGACAVAPAGLVGWWRAEGDPRDMLANGHGTSGGKFEPGVVGQAFSFGGTAPGIIVGDPAAFHTQDFSIEAWVKRASTSLASQLGFGAALFSGGGGSYSLVILDDGALGVSQVGVDKVLSTGRVTDTRWHHVAVTKAGPDVRFYIDGAAAGSAGYDRTFTFGTPFAIGSLGVTIGQNYTFLGSIDELSLYKRALSATELGSIYSAGSFGKCAPRPENIQLTATAPANAQPGTDFMVTFTLENHGTQPATGAALSLPLPTSFTLVTNTTSQGASFRAGGALLTVLGPLPGGGNAVVTLTGHGTTPASLVFHGQATRDGTDVSLDDNQADAGVEVLGPCVPAPSGLVAWLRAEGAASDVFSDSGTFTGNPRYAAGKTGLAFDLDGASEIVINDSPELDQSSFTIETWIYPTVVDGTVDIIANKETSYPSLLTDIQFELGIKGPLSDAPSTIPMGNLAFFVSGVRGLPDNYGGWTDAKAAIPLNQWTHVAFTVAPGTVTAYVNGAVTFKATELTGSPVANNWPLKIGSRSTVYVTQVRPQDRFNGRIDEFSFYGRALTGAEIGSVFQAGSAGKCIPAYPPSIQAGPSDQTVSVGTDGRFSVVATGTGPLRYQWRFQD